MEIRPARPHEAALLSELAVRSKAHWGYDAAFMASCREELTLRAADIATHPTFVLEQAGQLLGFYALETLTERRCELSYLFLAPERIGRGHGRALLEHAKAEARAAGAELLELQGDPHARGFYEAAGAREVGQRASASIPGRMLPLFELDLRSGD